MRITRILREHGADKNDLTNILRLILSSLAGAHRRQRANQFWLASPRSRLKRILYGETYSLKKIDYRIVVRSSILYVE